MLKNKKIILILLFIFFNINYSFSMDLYSNKIKDNIEISKFKKVNSNYLFLLNKKNDSLNDQVRIRAQFSNIFQKLDNYRILSIEKLPFNYLNDFILSDTQIGSYQYYISRKLKEIFGVNFLFKLFRSEYLSGIFNGWYTTISNELLSGRTKSEREQYLIARKIVNLNLDQRFIGLSLDREYLKNVEIMYLKDSNGKLISLTPTGYFDEEKNILIFTQTNVNWKELIKEYENNEFKLNVNEIFIWFKEPSLINKNTFLKNLKIVQFSLDKIYWENFNFTFMHDNKTFYIYDKTSTNYIENKDILTTKEFQKFLLDSFVIKNKKKFKFNNDNILNSNPKDFFFAINLEGKNNIIEFKNNLFITAKSLKYNKDYLKLYLLIKQDNYKKTPISSVKNNTTNNIYFNSILLLSIFIILSLTLIKKYFIKKKYI